MVTRRESRTGRRNGSGSGFDAWPERERRVLDQYLERYAEPEAAYGTLLTARYRAAVVAPLRAESPALLAHWETLSADHQNLPVLWIAVVNAREDDADEVLRANEELLTTWRASSRSLQRLTAPAPTSRARASASAELLVRGDNGCHVLLLDASSPGRRFPRKQGVGLARRIGCDVAVTLARRGQLQARYIGSADGDAELPAGYVRALQRPPTSTALLFPFEHVGGGEPRVLEATELVELSWRYYVLGLAWAGSPFAYHTVGSCLAPEVVAYARARGFPRREAAEDFHLLAKLAKLGEVEGLREPLVRLTARVSERVPFGTGPAVRRALAGSVSAAAGSPWEHFTLHDPRVFAALRSLLRMLRGLATGDPASRDPAAGEGFGAAAGELPEEVRAVLAAQAEHWRRLLAPRLASCPTGAHRLHRVFEAFDALATLQAVHAFRDAGLTPLPWRRALAGSPFLPAGPGVSAREALELARGREVSLGARQGLALGPREGQTERGALR